MGAANLVAVFCWSVAADATKAIPGNLLEAVKRKDAKRTRQLLELGAALAPRDQLLRSPLHLSAAAGEEQLTRLLLAFHADPDVVDAQQRTPLHQAALQGHSAVCLALLQNGASAKLRDEEGDSPLHLSARPKYAALALARLLADAMSPTSPTSPTWPANDRGETPLHAMALRGRAKVVRMLLAQRADASVKDNRGWTALSAAAARGHSATARVLLDASPVGPSSGASPLALAAKAGHAEMVQFLQLKGLRQDPLEGYSPLEWATRTGHHAVMELLSAEADAADAEHCVSRPLDVLKKEDAPVPMFSRSSRAGS
ncbi:unnamed protein product [Cladocopium goreaui]|uniref:Heterokaryon incompatibility domain-containing protein n=1 Tax=Cladocopium goreaui TaxID=2562237 RepID=A0A9P1BMF7_9DINO|nr:unnamed protein product [Cladocopium goreaui]